MHWFIIMVLYFRRYREIQKVKKLVAIFTLNLIVCARFYIHLMKLNCWSDADERTVNQAAWFLCCDLKRLYSSERIFQGSSNSKSTVRRRSGTCESASESRTKITRYGYKPPCKSTYMVVQHKGTKPTSFTAWGRWQDANESRDTDIHKHRPVQGF